MKLIVDMNLSPAWVTVLNQAGHVASHWSNIGAPSAKDREIMAWARDHGYTVFTHDLDFGSILAATNAEAPSVIQIRTQDPTPLHCATMVLNIIRKYNADLTRGALISVDENRARLHILPLRKDG
ncbi:MAG TPA: DUF5615 family PIN-like protein [Kiritimatiellia bacterium]|nr:DUF5615 family PIN-like protein [Kiritimatiellia bacterium]HMO98431.1 DUF5615 family PIN-like protein [Kiritimatiellia bacterium]HMP95849.1 DUF5615 family PIN-like protein [Kiritimatiellia bacterium]